MDSLSAAVTIVGSLVTIVLGAFGFFVKKSLDERNTLLQEQAERRLRLDSDRAATAQKQAEQRLRLDSAVQALQLMTSARENAAPEQAAGALFALVHLDQMGFALALLGEMWSSNRISGSAAKWVLDQAFSRGTRDQHSHAARIIEHHPEAFADHGRLFIPESVYASWPEAMDDYTRYILLLAIARSVHRVPCEDSTDIQAALITGIFAMRQEPSGAVDPTPHDAALFVSELGTRLYGRTPVIFGVGDGRQFNWADVLEEATASMRTGMGTIQMTQTLGAYADWGRE